MNELHIKGMYVYFKTSATTYEEAERELEKACKNAGIEMSCGYDGVLRNENGEDIDYKITF